jgi:F-type H+-transporting ATPase subunit delta
MLGPSRQSLADARRALVAQADDPDFPGLADELLAISGVLGKSHALRGALADAGTAAERKQALVEQVFGGKVSPLAVRVLSDVVSRRWSSERDLTDAVEQLGAEAAFVIAERAGTLDTIEDELFRFGRIAEGQPELLATLDDLSVDSRSRAGVIRDLLQGKADPTTVKLLEHVTLNPRGRRFEDALAELSKLAAARRDQLVADVRTATPLTAEQEQRLSAALARIYGRDVHLQVAIDSSIMGGVVVRIGDEIIDGSIATRLEQARRQLAS